MSRRINLSAGAARPTHRRALLGLLGVLLVTALPLRAGVACVNGGPPNCGQSDPGSSPVTNSVDSGVKNPIHVVTGNKYQREVDHAPYRNDRRLAPVLIRHYNSLNTKAASGFGATWSMSYDVKLGVTADNERQIVQSDGRRVVLVRDEHANDARFAAVQPADGYVEQQGDGHRWVLADGRVMHFNAYGKLDKIVGADGAALHLRYNAKRRISEVADDAGRTLHFQYYQRTNLGRFNKDGFELYEKAGRISKITLPDGGVLAYHYDGQGNLSQVTYPKGATRRYHYEDVGHPHALTGITDETGRRYATWAYDDEGRAALSEHAGGAGRVTLAYRVPEKWGEIGTTRVTDSLDRTTTYTWRWYVHEGVPLLLSAEGPGCTDCPAGDTSYDYNDRFQLTATHQKDGTVQRRDYDDQGRLARLTREADNTPAQLIARYEYTGNSRRASAVVRPSINPAGKHRVEITYTATGKPLTVTEKGWSPNGKGGFEPIERRTALTYERGQLTTLDGPRDDVADVINLAYDTQQRLANMITPDGGEYRVLAYDRYDRPVKVQRNQQSPTELNYDARGQITRVVRGERTVRYEYNAAGDLIAITDPDGARMTLDYDEAGRLNGLALDEGHRLALELDSEGRPVRRSLKHANLGELSAVSYLYDAEGRLSSRQDQDGRPIAQYDYDAGGRLTEISNASGQQTAFRYGALGQLLSVTQPGGGITKFSQDAGQRLASVTDARNNTHQTDYDDFGRAVSRSNPDTGTTRYAYNAAGKVTARTDASGTTVKYHYDAANRLVEKQSPEGTERFIYHPAGGGLAEVSGQWGRETFTYDEDGRLAQHTRHFANDAFTTAYDYNAAGRLSEKHLPDGQTLAYHYYDDGQHRGRLRAITRKNWLSQDVIIGEIDYDSLLGVTGFTHGNGIRTDYRYGAGGKLTAIQTQGVLALEYDYDALGHITGLAIDGEHQRYRYDVLGRLARVESPTGNYAYQYDAVGNRTAKLHTTPDGVSQRDTYRYPGSGQGNRLLSVAQTTTATSQRASAVQARTYTATGSPDNQDAHTYIYNSEQRPTQVSKANQTLAAYRYNSFGERIQKVTYKQTKGQRTKVTYYLYDGHTLTAEAAPGGKVLAQYLYFNNQPIAKLDGKQIYALHTDHLGTPRAASDAHGTNVWRADYTPFGEATITRETITLNLRFPGQYFDAETGTHYNYLRDYDPKTGRYLTSDPIGLKGGVNTYAYVNGNPLSFVDPLGLLQELAPAKLERLLAKAGVIATRDGWAVGPADAAAIGFIIGFATGWVLDKAGLLEPLKPMFVSKADQGYYNDVIREIELYKPDYKPPVLLEPTVQDFNKVLIDLYDVQREYLYANKNVCLTGYNAELYQKATDAVTLRLQLDALLGGKQFETAIKAQVDENIKKVYEDYKANGGKLTLEDWILHGMPESDDGIVGGSKTGGGTKGAVSDANFAQSSIRSDETFSPQGQKKYSDLVGRPIETVDDLADALRNGEIDPSQIPVDYVVIGGNKLILNTRTSVALNRAGISKSEWYGVDKTGVEVPGMPGKTFDDLAREQLERNELPPEGTPDIPD